MREEKKNEIIADKPKDTGDWLAYLKNLQKTGVLPVINKSQSSPRGTPPPMGGPLNSGGQVGVFVIFYIFKKIFQFKKIIIYKNQKFQKFLDLFQHFLIELIFKFSWNFEKSIFFRKNFLKISEKIDFYSEFWKSLFFFEFSELKKIFFNFSKIIFFLNF